MPDRGPATLGWWDEDTSSFAAFAVWTVDHWEYETDDWSGRDPGPGDLPEGASDPRTTGWRQTSDGAWTQLSSPPPVPTVPARVSAGASLGMIACLLAGLFGALIVLFASVFKVQYWLTDDAGNVLPTPRGGGGVGGLAYVFTGVPCLLGMLIATTARRGERRSSGLLTAAVVLSILTIFSGCLLVQVRSQVKVECFACTDPASGGGTCVRRSGGDLTTHVVGESGVQCSIAALNEAESGVHLDQLLGALIAATGVVSAGIAAGLRWQLRPSEPDPDHAEPEDELSAASVGLATGLVLGAIAVGVIAALVVGGRVTGATARAFTPAPPLPQIGQTQVASDGASVTVHTLDVLPTRPGPGEWTITIDAEVCAGPAPVTAKARSFRLSETAADLGFDHEGEASADPSAFPIHREVAPGACERGVVTFMLYAASQPARAVVHYGSGTELRWQWP